MPLYVIGGPLSKQNDKCEESSGFVREITRMSPVSTKHVTKKNTDRQLKMSINWEAL